MDESLSLRVTPARYYDGTRVLPTEARRAINLQRLLLHSHPERLRSRRYSWNSFRTRTLPTSVAVFVAHFCKPWGASCFSGRCSEQRGSLLRNGFAPLART